MFVSCIWVVGVVRTLLCTCIINHNPHYTLVLLPWPSQWTCPSQNIWVGGPLSYWFTNFWQLWIAKKMENIGSITYSMMKVVYKFPTVELTTLTDQQWKDTLTVFYTQLSSWHLPHVGSEYVGLAAVEWCLSLHTDWLLLVVSTFVPLFVCWCRCAARISQ